MNFKKDVSDELNERHKRILALILKQEGNKTCADCKTRNPTWASVNLGVFVCLTCSGIHRSLGVHISQVRSCNLDTWLPKQVEFVKNMGNIKANAYWEAQLPDHFRRPPGGQPNPELAAFIRAKYEERRYAATDVAEVPNIHNYTEHPYVVGEQAAAALAAAGVPVGAAPAAAAAAAPTATAPAAQPTPLPASSAPSGAAGAASAPTVDLLGFDSPPKPSSPALASAPAPAAPPPPMAAATAGDLFAAFPSTTVAPPAGAAPPPAPAPTQAPRVSLGDDWSDFTSAATPGVSGSSGAVDPFAHLGQPHDLIAGLQATSINGSPASAPAAPPGANSAAMPSTSGGGATAARGAARTTEDILRLYDAGPGSSAGADFFSLPGASGHPGGYSSAPNLLAGGTAGQHHQQHYNGAMMMNPLKSAGAGGASPVKPAVPAPAQSNALNFAQF